MKKNEEYFTSICQIFDGNNQYIGYEYIVKVDTHHTLIKSYDSAGKLLTLKHEFDNPLNEGSVDDFVAYMNKTQSIGSQYNYSYIQEMKKLRPIDLNSSINEAKLYKRFEK